MIRALSLLTDRRNYSSTSRTPLLPPPQFQVLSKNLKWNNEDEKCRPNNSSLDPQTFLFTFRSRPSGFEIRKDELAGHPPSIGQHRVLTWSSRVRVKHVRVDRRRDDHDSENEDTQADRDDLVMSDTLEIHSHEYDAEDDG